MSSGDSIYSQEIRFKTWKCIRSSSDMYEHRPGNASDRARMKTFSFRLGDLDGDGFVLEMHQIELG